MVFKRSSTRHTAIKLSLKTGNNICKTAFAQLLLSMSHGQNLSLKLVILIFVPKLDLINAHFPDLCLTQLSFAT